MLLLKAQKRELLKRKTNKLREKGFLPAILYGAEIKSIPLKVNLKEFEEVYKKAGETTLISLQLEEDKKDYSVLVHDFQRDPITGKFLHVDFFQPALREEIEVKVPLKFVGESEAVKSSGGTLIKEMSELEIKGLPQNLPHEIEVDISKLKKIDDVITVNDLKLPEGIKSIRKPEEIVVLVTPPEKEEVGKALKEGAEEEKAAAEAPESGEREKGKEKEEKEISKKEDKSKKK